MEIQFLESDVDSIRLSLCPTEILCVIRCYEVKKDQVSHSDTRHVLSIVVIMLLPAARLCRRRWTAPARPRARDGWEGRCDPRWSPAQTSARHSPPGPGSIWVTPPQIISERCTRLPYLSAYLSVSGTNTAFVSGFSTTNLIFELVTNYLHVIDFF